MQSQTYVRPFPSPLPIECQQQCIFVQGSSQYMDAVYSKFVKNFDKFDLYVRRNIVAVPANVADAVAARYAASKDASATPYAKYNSSILEMHVASSVSLDKPKETEAEHELADLRHQLAMKRSKHSKWSTAN
uniref:Uncharacterized protein n=1 Tax=Globisporangium ultimum (strain ATCC 200006 / CBS 805.95 / DAOM BR144) TaxID=431595 RepID=K3WXV8_GLOUD